MYHHRNSHTNQYNIRGLRNTSKYLHPPDSWQRYPEHILEDISSTNGAMKTRYPHEEGWNDLFPYILCIKINFKWIKALNGRWKIDMPEEIITTLRYRNSQWLLEQDFNNSGQNSKNWKVEFNWIKLLHSKGNNYWSKGDWMQIGER